MLKAFKKMLPFQKAGLAKPLHAGEIYFLWEGLTSGYKLIEVMETYMMNTDDKELQLFISGIIKGTYMTRIASLEKLLKDNGYSVPPRPAAKSAQGKPGVGQEVKLTDDEVLGNIFAWGQSILQHDAKAVAACTEASVRKIIITLLFDDIKAFKALKAFAESRNALIPPPPATAKQDSINMEEAGLLWNTLRLRSLSVQNLEQYIASTNDKKLISLLKRGIDQISLPQLEKIESILKEENFTVPPRPARRIYQGPPGELNKIKLSDDEIIGVLITAAQFAIFNHAWGFISSKRADIMALFEGFLSTEIEEYEKTMDLAVARHALDNPPVVTSRSG